MNAHHVLDLIATYRELTPNERRLVDGHVVTCETCAAALRQAQRIDALLTQLPDRRSAPAQEIRWRQRIEAARPAANRGRNRGWSGRPQLAWLLIIVLAGVLAGNTAAQSLPGAALYPLKLAGEQARGWLIWDVASQGEWQLARARTRLDEINQLTAQGRQPTANDLLRLQDQITATLVSAAHAPLPNTVRLLQETDDLASAALASLAVWERNAPPAALNDLAALRTELRRQRQVIGAGLADPERFRRPPTDPTPTPPRPTETPTATPAATTTFATPLRSAVTPTPAPTQIPTLTASPTPARPAASPVAPAPTDGRTPPAPPAPTGSPIPTAPPAATLPPAPTRTPTIPPTPTRTPTIPPTPTRTPTIPLTPGNTRTMTPAPPTATPTASVAPPTATATAIVTPIPTPTRRFPPPRVTPTRTPRRPPPTPPRATIRPT